MRPEAQEALTKVAEATKAVKEAQEAQEAAVVHALESGATWAAVGGALGRSRQAAQEKYRHLGQYAWRRRKTEGES